ncbi:hypothetical protein ABE220_11710 [Bacillus subtilis]
MLVEDDHSISEMVDHYLTKEGFGIVHAFDGEEGIRLFQQGSYDLVLIAGGLTFITILLSNILIAAGFFWLNSIYHFIPGELTSEIISQQAVKMAVFAFGAAGTSLVPIFFGMRRHSVPATIISSVVIVMLISSTSPGFSISSVVYIPLSLAAFGLFFSYMAIRNADKQDA